MLNKGNVYEKKLLIICLSLTFSTLFNGYSEARLTADERRANRIQRKIDRLEARLKKQEDKVVHEARERDLQHQKAVNARNELRDSKKK